MAKTQPSTRSKYRYDHVVPSAAPDTTGPRKVYGPSGKPMWLNKDNQRVPAPPTHPSVAPSPGGKEREANI